jgi:hypothetical protein
MEYINSRKRLIVDRHILGNYWVLQYRVKTIFGYKWVGVASVSASVPMTVNQVISYLEDIREYQKWMNKGYEIAG